MEKDFSFLVVRACHFASLIGHVASRMLLCCMLLACVLVAPAWAADAVKEVGVREAAEMIKDKPDEYIVLDVRTPGEFRDGHLPHAKNVDFFGGSFETDILKLPRDKPVLIYCRSGKRSAGAVEILREAGFENILDMHEGMLKWEKEGLPLEK